MKRSHLFIVILIIFLSGCSDESIEVVQTSNSVGLVTGVYADSLPDSLFEGDQIFLQLSVENQGDYDVAEGEYHLNVKGINPAAYDRLSETDLEHISSVGLLSLGAFGNETIVRGQEVFTIGNSFLYCNDIDNDLPLNLHAKSCYNYGTTSELSGCFIQSSSSTGEGICTVSEYKSVTNSVAPVAITEVAESVAGASEVRFRVKVENLGDGLVFDKYGLGDITETIQKCDDLPRGTGWNVIYIDSITLDGARIDNPPADAISSFNYEGGVEHLANGRNRFRLDNTGSGRFSFTYGASSLDFVGKVGIELSYGYSETDIFSTTIKALSDFSPTCDQSSSSSESESTTSDGDGDGIDDDVDECPNTPEGSEVDATGCIPQV